MANQAKHGEKKKANSIRLTPTAKTGLNKLTERVGIPAGEVFEYFGRACNHPVMQEVIVGVLTASIVQYTITDKPHD
jgi:hypothetical protein